MANAHTQADRQHHPRRHPNGHPIAPVPPHMHQHCCASRCPSQCNPRTSPFPPRPPESHHHRPPRQRNPDPDESQHRHHSPRQHAFHPRGTALHRRAVGHSGPAVALFHAVRMLPLTDSFCISAILRVGKPAFQVAWRKNGFPLRNRRGGRIFTLKFCSAYPILPPLSDTTGDFP